MTRKTPRRRTEEVIRCRERERKSKYESRLRRACGYGAITSRLCAWELTRKKHTNTNHSPPLHPHCLYPHVERMWPESSRAPGSAATHPRRLGFESTTQPRKFCSYLFLKTPRSARQSCVELFVIQKEQHRLKIAIISFLTQATRPSFLPKNVAE